MAAVLREIEVAPLGPAPCDDCQNAWRCGLLELACKAFQAFVRGDTWESLPRTEPSRKLYLAAGMRIRRGQYATRIQARAIRKGGELFKTIQPKQGGDRRSKGRERPIDTRRSAAENAGISERQRKTMQRVANVPDADFERQVESERPPTVTQLATNIPHLSSCSWSR